MPLQQWLDAKNIGVIVFSGCKEYSINELWGVFKAPHKTAFLKKKSADSWCKSAYFCAPRCWFCHPLIFGISRLFRFFKYVKLGDISPRYHWFSLSCPGRCRLKRHRHSSVVLRVLRPIPVLCTHHSSKTEVSPVHHSWCGWHQILDSRKFWYYSLFDDVYTGPPLSQCLIIMFYALVANRIHIPHDVRRLYFAQKPPNSQIISSEEDILLVCLNPQNLSQASLRRLA